MRVLIDTNVLISASRSLEGNPYRAFLKAVTVSNQGVVCDQNLDELRRVYNRKFPDKLDLLQAFLSFALPILVNKEGTAITLVTHDAKVAAMTECVLFMKDGKIVDKIKLSKFNDSGLDGSIKKITEKMQEIGI